jgi:hypothetical protein
MNGNAFYEEIDGLKAANQELLEACKRSMDFAQEILNLLVGYQTEHFNSNINGARGTAMAIMDNNRDAIAKAERGKPWTDQLSTL